MWKYYALMFVAVALILAYTYVADPCHKMLRTDFAKANPNFVILDSEAESGAPESVHCRISYQKPGDDGTYEDVWVYHRGRRVGSSPGSASREQRG